MTPRRPDVLIYCEGTSANPHKRYDVQRARWMVTQSAWVPVLHQERQAFVVSDQSVGNLGGEHDHITWSLPCALCTANPPFRDERMQITLSYLANEGMTLIPLYAVQRAIEMVSPNSASSVRRAPNDCYCRPTGVTEEQRRGTRT